jgi:hypothetical protein
MRESSFGRPNGLHCRVMTTYEWIEISAVCCRLLHNVERPVHLMKSTAGELDCKFDLENGTYISHSNIRFQRTLKLFAIFMAGSFGRGLLLVEVAQPSVNLSRVHMRLAGLQPNRCASHMKRIFSIAASTYLRGEHRARSAHLKLFGILISESFKLVERFRFKVSQFQNFSHPLT